MRNLLRNRRGQALVEFALAATLIFFLLAAAVDLGLIFFTVQGLHNAAQEGAAYGSRWLVGTNPRALNLNGIRDRVRLESGSKGGIGFVNLLDLNNDGQLDVAAGKSVADCTAALCQRDPATGKYIVDDFIDVQLLWDTDFDGNPMNDLVGGQPTPCTDPSKQSPCFIRVTVSFNYKTVFPLTPGFARVTRLRSSYIVRLRDTFSEAGEAPTPPIFSTVTPVPPTPTPEPLVVTVNRYTKASGNNQPVKIKVSVTRGGQPLSGARITVTIGSGSGQVALDLTDGGNGVYYACSIGSFNGNSPPNGTLTAVAGTSSGAATLGSSIGSASAACP